MCVDKQRYIGKIKDQLILLIWLKAQLRKISSFFPLKLMTVKQNNQLNSISNM
jgi:hypothetical protein